MTSYILAQIALVEAALLCVPFILAVFFREDTIFAYGITLLIIVALSAPFVIKKPKNRELRAREGFVTVALAWIMLSLFGCLPAFISGYIPKFFDSLFEIASGFTTTGATILPNIEAFPRSLLFWRSLTHWIGGMGVLVFVIAIIPKSDANIIHLFLAESPGPQAGKLVSKLKFTARILYGIYIGMTVLEIILLLIGKMPLFDSFIHAFGTAGTGGFSNKNLSIAAYDSTYIDIVITVFMLLFSVNFNIYYLILIGNFRQAIKSEELRVFFGIVLVSTAVITTSLLVGQIYASFGDALKHSAFQVASIISTSGFVTTDFTHWPVLPQIVLFLLFFVGACAGSTGGGLKVSRVIILLKTSFRELKRSLSPRTVVNVKFEGKPLDASIYNGVMAYFVLYITIFIVSALLLSFAPNVTSTNYLHNFTAVASCLNNVGPGFGAIGPYGNFADFNIFSKIVLIFDMLAGRLELLPMLLLFNPKVWRKI